jgi:hypothetical protein
MNTRCIPFAPTFPVMLQIPEKKKPTPWILPHQPLSQTGDVDFALYLRFIEQTVRHILPTEIALELTTHNSALAIREAIITLNAQLPLLIWNDPMPPPCITAFTFLCPAEFTNGVGRYLCDTLSRWLVPGKFLNICSVQSLHFRFSAFQEQGFFVQQILLEIADAKELAVAKENWEHLRKEVRLNVLAVKHARHVVAIKSLSAEQKRLIIEENIASVIDRSSKQDLNVFDQMHHFLIKLIAEEKITQIKDRFTPFMEQRPKFFDRDIFNEIKRFVTLYSDEFTAFRDLRHVGRIISFQFLFRKTLQKELLTAPHQRHVSLKLLKVQLKPPGAKRPKTALSLLGGINVLRDSELFEERHIFESLQRCMPCINKIDGSFVLDRRSHDPILLFYIEIEKYDGSDFSIEEIRKLRKRLPEEIKDSIENVIHPVFMPRNEEEILRNILILSLQLKYLHDLPQVVISFDTQTETELCFTVIALRIVKPNDKPLHTLLLASPSALTFEAPEVRHTGLLRKKYVKEANVFKVKLDKRPFLRKDYSLDLLKARQALSHELNHLLGGIRDFNGGILSKQQEVFQELRSSLGEIAQHHDFLLENFFYSLTPSLRQSFLLPTTLHKLFSLFLEARQQDYSKRALFLKSVEEEDFLLLMVASQSPTFKEEVFSLINQLQIPASDLTFTYVYDKDTHYLGYIYHSRDPLLRANLYKSLESGHAHRP